MATLNNTMGKEVAKAQNDCWSRAPSGLGGSNF
jgi:hypothetical protein